MRNKKNKYLGIEIDSALHYKLHYISKYEGRSANGQILYLIRSASAILKQVKARSSFLKRKTGNRIRNAQIVRFFIFREVKWQSKADGAGNNKNSPFARFAGALPKGGAFCVMRLAKLFCNLSRLYELAIQAST